MSRTIQTAPDTPLRRMRRARTLSQQQLASLARVSQRTVSRAELGLTTLSPDLQELIATILGAPRQDLFPPSDPEANT